MHISTIILSVLKKIKTKVYQAELLNLVRKYYSEYANAKTPTETEILHALDLLIDDNFVIRTHNGVWEEFQISNKGYAKLKAWYAPKKMITLISNDFAKILSIVATILSILATYLSIKSKY